MQRIVSATAAIAVLIGSLILTSGTAEAHERRNVGPYQLVVGWLSEPAFAGQPNAATVRVSDTRATPATAVEGLEKTLKIAVTAGGLTPFTGTVRAVFGQAGLYALDMYPTVAGQYRYTVTGTIGTQTINETFESGPTTFNDVQPVAALQYPLAVPAGEDLARRLDAIQSAVDQTRMLAIAAVALGVIAIAAAAVLSRRRA